MLRKDTIENPFPGLRPFNPDESHLFFGRDGQSDELLERLEKNRFLAVVGTSGSGKSSLLRAGLLPTIHGGFAAGAGSHWRVAVFRPGDNPVRNLAESLSRPGVLNGKPSSGENEDSPSRIVDTEIVLRRGSLGVVELFRQSRLPEEENLLIIVDQFEELFRFKESNWMENAPDEAAAFVKLLLKTAAQKEVPIFIVIAMRSEFLGDCAQFRDLPEAVSNSQYLIPRMTRDEKREAVEGPVAVGGAGISPALVSRLLNDVGDNPDQLPILQHALMRTWDYWAKNRQPGESLDIHHYEAVGTMKRALSQHAEEAFTELMTEESRTVCEKMFKLLTRKGDKVHGVRRPSKVGEICAVTGASEKEVIHIVNIFRRPGRTFLMPPGETALDKESVIDISHESLMRIWERLIGWVREEEQSAELYCRLSRAAALHEEGNARPWGDPELMNALKWQEKNRPNAAWAKRYDPSFDRAVRFLELSKEQQKREIREKEKLKRMKEIRLFSVIITIAAAVSIFLALWAFSSRTEAKRQEAIAKEQRRLAEEAGKKEKEAREEAEKARVEEAIARKYAEAQRDMADILKSMEKVQRIAAEVSSEREREQRIVADKNAITAEANELKAQIEELISGMNKEDAAFGQKLAKAKESAAQSLAETRDMNLKARSVITAYRRNVSAYDDLRRSTKAIFDKFDGNLPAGINESERKMLSGAYGNLKDLYNRLQEKSKKKSVPPEIFESLRKAYIAVIAVENADAVFYPAESRALAAAGERIVFNDWEGRLVMAPLKPGPGSGLIPFPRKTGSINLSGDKALWAGAFAETGDRLYCAARDGRIYYWDKNDWKEKNILVNAVSLIHSPVLAMVVSRNKNSLIYAVRDTIYSYGSAGNAGEEVEENPGIIRALTLIENRDNIFLLYGDGSVGTDKNANIYCLDLTGKGKGTKRVAGILPSGGVYTAVYNEDKKLLALGTEEGKIHIGKIDCEDLRSGVELEFKAMVSAHKGIVKALAFSPGGRYMASGGLDNSIMLWDLDGTDETAVLYGEPVLTINNDLKILSVTFDSEGKYMIFSDEQYLQVCPTGPEILYNELCRKAGKDPGLKKGDNDDT